jgi:hypothetical protein
VTPPAGPYRAPVVLRQFPPMGVYETLFRFAAVNQKCMGDPGTGDEFNERLMRRGAAILPGRLCDMARRGDRGPLGRTVRFSFGPLAADSCEQDLALLGACLQRG